MFNRYRRAATRILRPALLIVACLAMAAAPALAQNQPEPLFADAAVAANRAADTRTFRARAVSVRMADLDAARTGGPSTTLGLNLFTDATFTAVLDRIDPTTGGYVWVGRIPDVALSTVTLAIEGSVIYGSVITPAATYLIKPAAAGLHTIEEIDQSTFPAEAPPLVVETPRVVRGAAADPAAPQPDDGSFIDVIVLYTPAAAAAAPAGPTGITALINNAISVTNTSYANSGIVQRLRLAYSGLVNYTETGGATGLQTDLTNITDGVVSGLTGVAALRETYHADLVSLLTDTPGSIYCGIAWKMASASTDFAPNAFSVVEQSCAVGNLSFPHELGHNMGAGHDWYVDDSTTPDPAAHGYVNYPAGWRTIMAYNDLCLDQSANCQRLAYWANPSLTYGGAPLGIPANTKSDFECFHSTTFSPTCDADDRTTLNATRSFVANFRQSGISVPLAVSSLTSNLPLPQVVGTPITWTANATGGNTPYSYRFVVFDGTSWTVGQDWGPSNQFVWTPLVAGTYRIEVWVRNAGSSSVYDAYGAASVPISTRALTILSVTPSAPSVAAGNPVTWTVNAVGGTGPYSYVFLVYDGTSWSVGQPWGPSKSWTWKPPAPGTYRFQVWARNAGSVAVYDTYAWFGPYTVTLPATATLTSLTSSLPQYVPAGTPVTWTVKALGGTGPYSYRFMVYDGSSWIVGQEYASPNSWTWTPTTSGYYWVQVWVRDAGSAALFDSWIQSDSYYVLPGAPLTIGTLAADRTLPVSAGTPITWKAAAVGGTAPYFYRFVYYNTTTWAVGQEYSPSDTWTFTPPSAGTYLMQVWAKSAGSAALYDAWQGSGYFTVTPPEPLSAPTLTMAPMAPLIVGGPAVLTASAKGGSGPYTYRFVIFDGSTWSVGQEWSSSNTWTWTPSAPGTYNVQVWFRNAGSVNVYDSWQGIPSITVSP